MRSSVYFVLRTMEGNYNAVSFIISGVLKNKLIKNLPFGLELFQFSQNCFGNEDLRTAVLFPKTVRYIFSFRKPQYLWL